MTSEKSDGIPRVTRHCRECLNSAPEFVAEIGNTGDVNSTDVYDPLSHESHEDPYPAYARLRDEFPLYFIEAHGVWALSRYQDVREALRDWETFSSAQGVEIGEYVQFFGEGSIQELDPPSHDVLRKVLAPRFQSRRIKEYGPLIRATAEHLIDGFAGRSRIDLGQEFTQRLPILTIFQLLGIPQDDYDWATSAGLEMLRRPAGEAGPSAAAAALREELVGYFVDQVNRRRVDGPTDDLFSDMALGIDAGAMKESEIQGLTLLLIAAGMETTSSLMGNIAHAVATEAVAAEDLLDGTGAFRAPAIEEFLRFDAPGQWLARVTTRPVTMHGHDLPTGSRVLVLFASANRDPREYERADELVLDREGARNLAFGEGVHFCLGMPLARMETRIGMAALLARYPSFRLEGEPVRYPSHVIRGFESIPVTLS